ncbi:MAG: hypothetical protein WA634_20815, partial [Silvibacterium sp.]
MRINGNRWALTFLSIAVIAAPVAFAQQQQQDTNNQYQGVSQPPPDDTIVVTPDTPPPAVHAKPSPEVSAPAQAAVPQTYAPATASAPTVHNSQYDNTDYGIVTTPVPANHVNAAFPGDTAVLHTRSNYDANADIVTNVPESANELPEGTEIRVRLDQELSTNDTTVDTRFQGKVMVDVLNNGSVIIPAGSTLRGRVTQVSQGHHFGPAATLRLRPEIVLLPDGTAYHLYAEVLDSEASGTRTGSEGGIEPDAHVLKKTAEYGVGVGTGALVGAELAGPPGALAGSLIGAGLVTTHLLTQHPTAA